jgi:hypothetical protein
VRASRRTRTSDLQFRKLASYPLDHGSRVGGERFELSQPKPRLYGPLVSPMNSPPLGWPEGLSPSSTRVTTWLLVDFGIGHSTQQGNRTPVPAVLTRCSAIELAELAYSQKDSNPLRQFRKLPCYPLHHGSLRRDVPRSGAGIRTPIADLTRQRPPVERHRIEWRRWDLNPRSLDYESSALDRTAPLRCDPRRFRPVFSCLKGKWPSH